MASSRRIRNTKTIAKAVCQVCGVAVPRAEQLCYQHQPKDERMLELDAMVEEESRKRPRKPMKGSPELCISQNSTEDVSGTVVSNSVGDPWPVLEYAQQERARVIESCKLIGFPEDILEGLWRLCPVPVKQILIFRPFKEPVYRRDECSIDEWNAKCLRLSAEFHENIASLARADVGGLNPQPIARRNSGRNASIEERYRWTALRLAGCTCEQIAYQVFGQNCDLVQRKNTVLKATSGILKTTGFINLLKSHVK